MRKSLFAVVAIALLSCTGCSIYLPAQVEAPASHDSEVEMTSPSESNPDLCEAATAESIELLDAAMDRVERASSSAEIEEASAPMGELFSQAGANIGEYCGQDGMGWAYSELIVWASAAASSRPPLGASVAEGFLESVCTVDYELGIEFSPTAQIACAG